VGIAVAETGDAEKWAPVPEPVACTGGAVATGAREGKRQGKTAERRPRRELGRTSGCFASYFNFLPSAAAVPFPSGALA